MHLVLQDQLYRVALLGVFALLRLVKALHNKLWFAVDG